MKDNMVHVVNCIRSKTYTSSSEQLINTLINKHAIPFYVMEAETTRCLIFFLPIFLKLL